MSRPLFPIGRLAATTAALDAFTVAGEDPMDYVRRHITGDFGDRIGPGDREFNLRAIQDGTRVLSSYTLKDGSVIYVITEWDRSATTIMLWDEY